MVVPTFNHAGFLPRAVHALVSQSMSPEELVIVDDCSSDRTPDTVARLVQRWPFIRHCRNDKNLGVVASIERGVGATGGDFFLCAAADDCVLPGFFEQAMALAAAHPQTGVIMGKMLHVDEFGKALWVTKAPCWHRPSFVSPERFLREYLDRVAPTHALGAATIYRRSAFTEIGGFPRSLEALFDGFLARALGLKHGACYINRPCVTVTMLPGTYSATTSRNSKLMLEIVDRTAALMRSAEFRDVFPEDHVRRWERAFRSWIVLNRLLPFESVQDLPRDLERQLMRPLDGLDRLGIRAANRLSRTVWSLLWRRVMWRFRQTHY